MGCIKKSHGLDLASGLQFADPSCIVTILCVLKLLA